MRLSISSTIKNIKIHADLTMQAAVSSERFIAKLLHIVKRSGTMLHRQAENEARLMPHEAILRIMKCTLGA